MCDCLVCDCWWCGCYCTGFALQLLACGCWTCRPAALEGVNPDCCLCWQSSGLGVNLGCLGCILCVPEWLRTYSFLYNSPVRGLPESDCGTVRVCYPTIYQ